VQKLSYSPVCGLFISSKQAKVTSVEDVFYSSTVTAVSSYLVNTFSGWRDCFETELPRWRVQRKEKEGRIIRLPAVHF